MSDPRVSRRSSLRPAVSRQGAPMAPRSLKESTLSGLIVSHRDWQHKRFNALLSEEIRISNAAFSKQALLYDPLVSDLAFQLVLSLEDLVGLDQGVGLDEGGRTCTENVGSMDQAITETIVRMFQQIVLRRASFVPAESIGRWLNCISVSFQRSPGVAQRVLQELYMDKPCFEDSCKYENQLEKIQGESAQLERLQVLSQALSQVGQPLLLARGVRAQLLFCDCKVALDASIRLFQSALTSVASLPEADSLTEKLVHKLVSEAETSSAHSDSIETYGRVWSGFIESGCKPFLKACANQDVAALLVHIYLGNTSPGNDLDRGGKILPRLGVPEGAAFPNFAPLVKAVCVLANAPILRQLSAGMLYHQVLRNKLEQASIAANSDAGYEALLLRLCEDFSNEYSAAVIGFLLSKLREASSNRTYTFNSYTNSGNQDKASSENKLKGLLVKVLEASRGEPDVFFTLVGQLLDSAFETIEKAANSAVSYAWQSQDADESQTETSLNKPLDDLPSRLDIARKCASRCSSNQAPYGTAPFLFSLSFCWHEVIAQQDDSLVDEWLMQHCAAWAPLAEWAVLATNPESPDYIRWHDLNNDEEQVLFFKTQDLKEKYFPDAAPGAAVVAEREDV